MKKRIIPIVFCVLLLLSAALPMFAAQAGSITVWFKQEQQPVAGVSFHIYKAAEWNGSSYTLVSPFSNLSVKLADDPASEEWQALASTLSAYVARDHIKSLAIGQTNENGSLTFEGLADGLYLLVGSSVELGDTRLFFQPLLVSVPFAQADGTNDYYVVTEPKYESRKVTDETVTRRALKIWKDDGNEEKRPQNITVQLLCDGEIHDEQILSAENNWSYTWENLDAAHDWQLTEKTVPEDYTVEITQQDMTFTVTNTNDNPPPPPPTVPQTGLLWWPVPVLGGIGALALFFGIFLLLRKKDGSDV